jgi:hypothetical protein
VSVAAEVLTAVGRNFGAIAAACLLVATQEPVSGCPFCGAVGESLAGRRDAADAVVVGEAEGPAAADRAGFPSQRFRMHQVLRGDVAVEDAAVNARVDRPVEGTAILFGKKAGAAGEANPGLRLVGWSAVAADEMLLGYVVAAPGIREPAARRLEWFIARLEHPEPAIAEDAFTECGLAPFEAVRSAAAAFDAAKLRQWVGEPAIDQRRRGFYGLALGLVAATAAEPAEARACVAALHAAIEAPADDFRAGVDGLMAGILVAEGERGLDYLDGRGFFGPAGAPEMPPARPRPLDQRHLLSALRFAWESLGETIPPHRTAAATARLLASPIVAADAAVDLARYRYWDAVDRVAGLWDTLGRDDPAVRRSVAGFLAACPLPAARRHLDRIRAAQPDLLDRALRSAALPR